MLYISKTEQERRVSFCDRWTRNQVKSSLFQFCDALYRTVTLRMTLS